jgi:hypothetical protein
MNATLARLQNIDEQIKALRQARANVEREFDKNDPAAAALVRGCRAYIDVLYEGGGPSAGLKEFVSGVRIGYIATKGKDEWQALLAGVLAGFDQKERRQLLFLTDEDYF